MYQMVLRRMDGGPRGILKQGRPLGGCCGDLVSRAEAGDKWRTGLVDTWVGSGDAP